MKKFIKNDCLFLLIFFFLFLLFRYNLLFKKCVIEGCSLFLNQVFPFLFPMFLISDFLIYSPFDIFIEKTFHKIFKPLFGFSKITSSAFALSLISGTPTNAYHIANLVHKKTISPKEASIMLSYSCFLNPLFLYTVLTSIFHNPHIVYKLLFIEYFINFLIAFFYRKFPYQEQKQYEQTKLPFSTILSNSLKKSMNTLLMILGTILFYLLLCESMGILFKNPILNCFLNGFLETTGGLTKLIPLQISFSLKEVLAALFISFMGLSIHTQIKTIIEEEHISFKPFLKARILHMLLSTSICIILP